MSGYINKPKKVDRSIPTERTKESQKIYQSKKWKKLREAKRLNQPICERCLQLGKTAPTVDIHHKIPFSKGETPFEISILAYSYENLMAVCTACHDYIHRHYVEDTSLRMKLLKR